MAVSYRYRTYESGDELAINHLYYQVTGIKRTVDEFKWQWLSAPGGKAEIWLIEAVFDDGSTELIGHHGVMPVRFTNGNENYLFGKTENTMVLPEYRKKILYPRFEKKFSACYEARFDALFSTIGPDAAIRQRKAQGYALDSYWINMKVDLVPAASIIRKIAKISKTLSVITLTFLKFHALITKSPNIIALSSKEAMEHSFFSDFWDVERLNVGISPRRDLEDLKWRFWTNPCKPHVTLLLESQGSHLGYFIFSFKDPLVAVLEDFSFKGGIGLTELALKHAKLWLLKNTDSIVMSFKTTNGSFSDSELASLDLFFTNGRLRALFKRKSKRSFMPRKITAEGAIRGVKIENWNITPIVFQGR